MHALLDSGTGTLLAASVNAPAIMFVSRCVPDTQAVASVEQPNYVNSDFFRRLDGVDCCRWVWDRASRSFVEQPPERHQPEVQEKSSLAIGKLNVVARMMFNINLVRGDLRTGLEFQSEIYAMKLAEAERFQSEGEPDATPVEFPFLAQYASVAGIGLRQAADEIILKSNFAKDVLVKTENVRLRFYGMVKAASSVDQLQRIYEEFHGILFTNTRR